MNQSSAHKTGMLGSLLLEIFVLQFIFFQFLKSKQEVQSQPSETHCHFPPPHLTPPFLNILEDFSDRSWQGATSWGGAVLEFLFVLFFKSSNFVGLLTLKA